MVRSWEEEQLPGVVDPGDRPGQDWFSEHESVDSGLGVLIHMRSLPHQEAQLETWEVGPGGVGGWSPTFLTAVS